MIKMTEVVAMASGAAGSGLAVSLLFAGGSLGGCAVAHLPMTFLCGHGGWLCSPPGIWVQKLCGGGYVRLGARVGMGWGVGAETDSRMFLYCMSLKDRF